MNIREFLGIGNGNKILIDGKEATCFYFTNGVDQSEETINKWISERVKYLLSRPECDQFDFTGTGSGNTYVTANKNKNRIIVHVYKNYTEYRIDL